MDADLTTNGVKPNLLFLPDSCTQAKNYYFIEHLLHDNGDSYTHELKLAH